MLVFLVFFFLSYYPSCYVSTTTLNHNRRMLHQPLLFFTQGSSPPSLPPSLPPEPDQPQFPFTPSTNNNNNNNNNYNNYPFFPSVFSPPPPPPQQPQQQQPQQQQQQPQISDSPNTLTTLPANISSLLVPHYPHKDHHSPKTVLVVVGVAVTVFLLVGLSILLLILVVRRRWGGGIDKDVASSLDSHRLYPANIAHSDGQEEEEEDRADGGAGRAVAAAAPPNTAEFLYLGTLSTPRGGSNGGSNGGNGSLPYRKVGSPELHPLPPLSRSVPRSAYRSGNVGSSSSTSSSSASTTSTDEGEPNDHQFYSPRVEVKDLKSISNSNPDSPSSLASTNGSIKPICISRLKSPHEPPLPVSTLPTSPLNLREQIPTHVSGPPILVAPSGSANFLKKTSGNQAEAAAPQNPPNLKPLCGDVVGESTDQLKSRTLKKSNSTSEETSRREIASRENAVLDMKKSQNIAILLRALNMSTEEVCQALMEGNAGTLGTDLLGTLLRMAPTKDEEFKLKECKHDSLCNLGPAEQFLKAVLDIPFAFRRLDAMLYIANFDSEVEYLRMSFEILKIACQELRNSRMFQKFLQAMLNMRNRVNVADEADTFELETLLKLINAEGPDGKTIQLNFVIKEITRDEGIQDDDVELGKLKWNVIDDINMELTNVKKAAEMDSFALINDVSELVCGIKNVGEVVRLNEATGSKESNQRFSESMNKFLKKAEGHITRIQAHQSAAFFLVEEVTAYFHVNSAKKRADPFIIFKVVTDFLSILNQACKEVDKNNEQATFNTDNIQHKDCSVVHVSTCS